MFATCSWPSLCEQSELQCFASDLHRMFGQRLLLLRHLLFYLNRAEIFLFFEHLRFKAFSRHLSPEAMRNVFEVFSALNGLMTDAVEALVGGALLQRAAIGAIGAQFDVVERFGLEFLRKFATAAVPACMELSSVCFLNHTGELHDPRGVVVATHKADTGDFADVIVKDGP